MTREEKQKAIDALKISAPVMAVTQEEFNDYIQTLNKVMDWLEQEPFINKPCVSSGVCERDKNMVLDKIRAEITDCLKALDEIEKSGLNIYLPNEMSGRRLTYQQCLEFIDKYKAESEGQA